MQMQRQPDFMLPLPLPWIACGRVLKI
jgi:hypothetical protein